MLRETGRVLDETDGDEFNGLLRVFLMAFISSLVGLPVLCFVVWCHGRRTRHDEPFQLSWVGHESSTADEAASIDFKIYGPYCMVCCCEGLRPIRGNRLIRISHFADAYRK